MTIESVKESLKKHQADDRIQVLGESSAIVKDAALALNCKEEEIAKTMAFHVNDQTVVVVMAGDVKIANAKFKAEFGVKAKMIKGDQVEALTGHPPGGVCPFGLKNDVTVYLDESLRRFDTVYPACGSANSAIEITIEELETFTNFPKWVDISKEMN